MPSSVTFRFLQVISIAGIVVIGATFVSLTAQAGKVCCDPATGKSNGVSCVNESNCSGAPCQEICTTPESAENIANQITLPPFKAGSGILDYDPRTGLPLNQVFSRPISSSLLAEYMIALNNFFFRLAIILAVFMITLGGMQWLVAIGNASKIANAKETIQQAVIGLILALTATVLFNQIDTTFTRFRPLSVERVDPSKYNCAQYSGTGANKGLDACTKGGCNWNATTQICTDLPTSNVCKQDSDCKAKKGFNLVGGTVYIPLVGAVPILKPGESIVNGYCIAFLTNGTHTSQCSFGAPGEPCWNNSQCVSKKCDIVTGSDKAGNCSK